MASAGDHHAWRSHTMRRTQQHTAGPRPGSGRRRGTCGARVAARRLLPAESLPGTLPLPRLPVWATTAPRVSFEEVQKNPGFHCPGVADQYVVVLASWAERPIGRRAGDASEGGSGCRRVDVELDQEMCAALKCYKYGIIGTGGAHGCHLLPAGLLPSSANARRLNSNPSIAGWFISVGALRALHGAVGQPLTGRAQGRYSSAAPPSTRRLLSRPAARLAWATKYGRSSFQSATLDRPTFCTGGKAESELASCDTRWWLIDGAMPSSTTRRAASRKVTNSGAPLSVMARASSLSMRLAIWQVTLYVVLSTSSTAPTRQMPEQGRAPRPVSQAEQLTSPPAYSGRPIRMDRIRHMATHTIATTSTPIPMPGRLLVGRFDSLLEQAVIVPLAEVPAGTRITATATISRVRHLDPGRFGRVMLALTGDDDHWAFASVAPDTFHRVSELLIEGARVVVRGTAARSAGNVPAFINCLDVRPSASRPAAVLAGGVR